VNYFSNETSSFKTKKNAFQELTANENPGPGSYRSGPTVNTIVLI
jgi:hypothetical protein